MLFIFNFFKELIRSINPWFLFFILSLQVLGLISLYSAAYGSYGADLYLFKQQMIWIGLGWLVFFFVFFSSVEWISKFLWPLFFINVLALTLVFFLGEEIYNSRRWLDLGLFNYQPSETLKVILTLLMAQILSQRPLSQVFGFKDFLLACLIIIPPLFLCFGATRSGNHWNHTCYCRGSYSF